MLFGMPKDETGMPNLDVFKLHADFLYQEVKKGNIHNNRPIEVPEILRQRQSPRREVHPQLIAESHLRGTAPSAER